MYSFLISSVTSYCKLSGFKQHKHNLLRISVIRVQFLHPRMSTSYRGYDVSELLPVVAPSETVSDSFGFLQLPMPLSLSDVPQPNLQTFPCLFGLFFWHYISSSDSDPPPSYFKDLCYIRPKGTLTPP